MEVESIVTLSTDNKENPSETMIVTSAPMNPSCDKMEIVNERSKSPPENNIESDEDSLDQTIVPQKTIHHRRLRAIVDSDSEDETPTNTAKLNSPTKTNTINTENGNEDSDAEDESNSRQKSSATTVPSNNLEDRYKALLDSESEDEQPVTKQPHKEVHKSVDTKATKSQQKKRKGSIRASKEEAMKQIHSETQRLIRESSVSLPYHVPKQRTLEEFLNRKKVINTLPKAPTMAAKLKMSSSIVHKVLEEKEKEAELFYESSDSEEENKEVPQPTTETSTLQIAQPAKPKVIMVENIPIEETQKLLKNIKDARNKKEILQQGDLDLGMPRKLFEQEDEGQSASTSYVSLHPSLPRKLLHSIHETCETEKMETEDDDCCNSGVIKETIEKLLTTVENMMQDHYAQTETVKTAEVQEITETPHISKEDITKLLLKDDTVSNESIAHLSTTNQQENTVEAKKEEDKEEVPDCEMTPTNLENPLLVTPTELSETNLDKSKSDDDINLTNTTVSSVKNKFLSNLPPLQPRLRGTPGTVIDLMEDVKPDKKGVNQLIDRFFCKHSKVHKPTDNTNDVTVINLKETAEGPVVVKETLPYKLPTTPVAESPELSKPGAKLLRLQQELKHQMAMKRDEEWKEKDRQAKEEEEMFDEHEDDKDPLVDEKLSVSEECDNDEEEEEEELDEEMDDVYLKEKKRKTCAFADDEAEVSDMADTEEEEEDDTEDEDMELHVEEEGEEDTRDSVDAPKKRKLKRIIKAFDEDSCQSNTNDGIKDDVVTPSKSISRQGTDMDMFENDNGTVSLGSDNESAIPISQPYLTNESESGNYLSQQTQQNILGLTPITQLTPLKKSGPSTSQTSSEQNELKLSLGSISSGKPPSNVSEVSNHSTNDLQKKSIFNSNELSFTKIESPKNMGFGFSNEPNVSESELLELCSGAFTTQPIDMQELETEDASTKMSSSDLISSSEAKETQEASKGPGSLASKLRVVSSDEEDDDITSSKKSAKLKKRRKVKQLELSDDEDDGDEDNEESDVEDEMDAEEEEKFVDYDSEENEVVVVPKKDIKTYAAGFLENEAELSESDWDGSDDEDEKGLDKFEVEDGDNEEIDEEGAQKELGKFHMKRVFDEDQREVRMLKELLFEDGDLHTDGAGRERRFKWKNIDKLGMDDNNRPVLDENDGYVDFPEDENEIQWRKMKHEREKFLAEQNKKAEDDMEDVFQDSQIFQLGMKALQRSKSNQLKKEQVANDEVPPPRIQHTFTDLLDDNDLGAKSNTIQNIIRKRSILARGEASLARLAMIAKQSDASHLQMNTRNFIFQTITPTEEPAEVEKSKKEEREIDLNASRRKRKAFTDLTSQSTKRPKNENSQRGRGKKRF